MNLLALKVMLAAIGVIFTSLGVMRVFDFNGWAFWTVLIVFIGFVLNLIILVVCLATACGSL